MQSFDPLAIYFNRRLIDRHSRATRAKRWAGEFRPQPAILVQSAFIIGRCEVFLKEVLKPDSSKYEELFVWSTMASALDGSAGGPEICEVVSEYLSDSYFSDGKPTLDGFLKWVRHTIDPKLWSAFAEEAEKKAREKSVSVERRQGEEAMIRDVVLACWERGIPLSIWQKDVSREPDGFSTGRR